jgi:hypothetical protein
MSAARAVVLVIVAALPMLACGSAAVATSAPQAGCTGVDADAVRCRDD